MTQLRIYRELDTDKLAPLTREYLLAFEGQSDFVDTDLPRDDVFTEEIIDATVLFHIVDEDGKSLATFKNLGAAETARAGAKIEFKVQVDIPDEEPVKK